MLLYQAAVHEIRISRLKRVGEDRMVFLLPIFVLLGNLCLAMTSHRASYSRGNWMEDGRNDPDVNNNTTDLIASKGYPVEDHWVVTDDGYVISIQRIPRGKNENSSDLFPRTKPVVFLMHGVLQTSADFVINFPDQSLGFILADAGYDVWLGNSRGNSYGDHHLWLSKNSKKFWEFSFAEIGERDVTAFVDHIREVTGSNKIAYVGFSLGASIVLSMLSSRPEYNDWVHPVILLAPAVFFQHFKTILREIAPLATFSLSALGVDSMGLFQEHYEIRKLATQICGSPMTRVACEMAVDIFTGPESSGQINNTRLPVYISHSPSGISLRMVKHITQHGKSRQFSRFDFGPRQNLRVYGQIHAPAYDLGKIRSPIAILWSRNDWMVVPEDVAYLETQLKTLVESYKIEIDEWSHLDNVWGLEANKYVYPKVLKLLRDY